MSRTGPDTAAWIDLETDHTISGMKQRESMLFSINIFGIIVTSAMGVLVLRQGYVFLGINNIAVGAVLALSVIMQKVLRWPSVAGHVSMGAAMALFLMFLVQAGPDNSAVLWFNTYPLIVMFINGRRNGLIYSGIVMALAAVMLFTPVQYLLLNEFSGQMKIRIFLTFSLTAYVAYVYETLRDRLNTTTYRVVDELKGTMARLHGTNRELQEFVALTSHDLQEPVRKLLIFSRRLMKTATTDLSEAVIDNIVRIDNGINRMNTQLAGLREYARIVSEAVVPVRVDLKMVMEEVKHGLAGLIDGEHAIVIDNGLPAIVAGRLHMEVLLRHLVQNAVVFHRPGMHPLITVTAKVFDEGRKKRCEIYVLDNGIGIDERHRERIFNVFESISRDDVCVRAGIGLTVCRKITELHGGTLSVKSEPGKGSTFTAVIRYTEADS